MTVFGEHKNLSRLLITLQACGIPIALYISSFIRQADKPQHVTPRQREKLETTGNRVIIWED